MTGPRVLHVGSYYHGENDIVRLMLNALERMLGERCASFDPKVFDPTPTNAFRRDGFVKWLDTGVLLDHLTRHRANVLVCNEGGISPTPEGQAALASRGIRRITIALSDPDDFDRSTSHFARHFDRVFTNTRQALPLYEGIGVKAQVLPFAADTELHRPLPVKRRYDVVVVGAARPVRRALVDRMRQAGLKVGCFGRRWRPKWMERAGFSKVVRGDDQVRAVQSGTTYLSFGETGRGFVNVKVGAFEAAACGACVLASDTPELQDVFDVGTEILAFRTPEEAVEVARSLAGDPARAKAIGTAARARVLREHRWEQRWEQVLAGLTP